ncbi:VWA domain-containing protein [Marinobacterium stanieri]|uniref:VWA domain-containing protein n=1 Tax=Marinobacterium stanieri TaxID=49186 RepID=UPI003A8EA5E2
MIESHTTHQSPLQPMRLDDLDSSFALLDDVPETLVPALVTNSAGTLQERLHGLVALRSSLLSGETPRELLPWPAPQAQEPLYEYLNAQGLLKYCHGNEEVVDALLADILEVLENKQLEQHRLQTALLKQYEQAALKDLIEKQNKRTKKAASRGSPMLSPELLDELQSRAWASSWSQLAGAGGWLPAIWEERLSVWETLTSVFSDLGVIVHLGFDLSKGFFQSHGWLDMVRLKEALALLPQLQDVIRTLGRMKASEDRPVIEMIMESMTTSRMQTREVKTLFVPMETRGITRSDSISRMLPQEAALLGHPVLKKLWHAKRAEHALLSYAVEGTELETLAVEETEDVEVKRAGKSRSEDRGPMIICLDTSGSMAGNPETIAKALALECLSVAAQEKRGCYVYLFGSRDEVKELELSPDEQGLDRLIGFLSMSFGGGTDAEGPLEMALERCKSEAWRDADILLVSDGAFPSSSRLSSRIKRRKQSHSLSVHGVLIGSGSSAMEKLCDPLHRFDTWLDLTP